MICLNCGKNIEDNVKFCKYCGSEVNRTESDLQQADFVGNRKVIKVMAVLVLSIIICMAIAIFVSYKNSPQEKIKVALEENDVVSANLYFDEITDALDKSSAREETSAYVDKIVADYLKETGEIDYTTVSNLLNILYSGILYGDQDVEEQIKLIDRINISRTHFATAEKYVEEGKKAEAILEYQEVIIEDEAYFKEAQETIVSLRNSLKVESLEEAEALEENGKLIEARAVLENAEKAISGDSQILSALEVIDGKIKDEYIAAIEEKISQEIVNGEYSTAFADIVEAKQKYPDNSTLESIDDELKNSYKTAQMAVLEEFYNSEDFLSAINLLNEMQGYLPEDTEVTEYLEEYRGYLPTPMTDLETYDERSLQNYGETRKDSFGNSYMNSITFYAEESAFEGTSDIVGKATYLVNGEYNRLSATLVYDIDIYEPDGHRGKAHLEVYSDDTLVYTSPIIDEDTRPISFEAKLLKDCHKVTIKLIPDNWFYSYIILGEPQFYNRK